MSVSVLGLFLAILSGKRFAWNEEALEKKTFDRKCDVWKRKEGVD